MKGLIAEIGNHHFGDVSKAKRMIRTARECGASYVKMQAIDTDEFKGGSMPRDFYLRCDLGREAYLECAAYGLEIGITVFFSVFGSKYADLPTCMPGRPYKISGGQFESFSKECLEHWNKQTDRPVVISIPRVSDEVLADKKACVSNMNIMYVTPYLPSRVDFRTMARYLRTFQKPIGYSDHSRGIDNCLVAVEMFGCQLVEKHFNLDSLQYFGGKIYRDSIHAANTHELEKLAKCMAIYNNPELENALPHLQYG